MIHAEDALIDWADHLARRQLGKQRYKQIAPAFKDGAGSGMKHKLIDICMKMRDERKGEVTR